MREKQSKKLRKNRKKRRGKSDLFRGKHQTEKKECHRNKERQEKTSRVLRVEGGEAYRK